MENARVKGAIRIAAALAFPFCLFGAIAAPLIALKIVFVMLAVLLFILTLPR